MYSRIAILPLFVVVACIGVYVWAQDKPPANAPQPPSLENLPRLLPPQPFPLPPENVPNPPLLPPDMLPDVPTDAKVPEEPPIVCPPDKHRGLGPGGCVDGPPDMGVTEINGIPYAEAEAIYERHKEELESIRGVLATGLSAYGIIVTVEPDHWTIPTQVEGLLVITRPPPELWGLGHTESQTSRPLYGGVLFGTPLSEAASPPQAACTMTTIVLAHGDPWLITAGHCMTPNACPQSNTPSNCPSGTSLWQCQRYAAPNLLLYQPASPGALPANVVGWTQRYVVQGGTAQSPITDVAAAAVDDNTVDRDRSLATHFNKSAEIDKKLEGWGFFSGQCGLPPLNSHVSIVAGNRGSQGSEIKSATILQYGQPEVYGMGGCPAGTQSHVTNQIELTPDNPGSYLKGGDSGSPIVDDNGCIIGMLNAGTLTGNFGVGTPIADVQNVLGYDSVYGQNATDLSVQVHPSFRTIMQGQSACTWAYIKNTGTVPAQNVAIENQTTYSPQPSFAYYTPAGVWNVPYTIPAGQTAQFAVCMTLNQPQIPINWIPNFYGTNAAAPVIKAAYNTFATRWTSTPLPDPIVWTATLSNDDVVHTNGPNGTGLFTVTTWNNGATGNVTLTLDTDWGYGGLPYTLWVCETNAQSQCISSLSSSLSLPMNAGATHYFLVLAQGQGQPVTLDPYYHRVFFRIREGNNPTGTLVGGAGLSITTN